MITLLIATRNTHKVGEIRAILGDRFEYLTLNDFPDAPEVIEDAGTFVGNATKKAVELAKWHAEVRSARPPPRSERGYGGRTDFGRLRRASASQGVRNPKAGTRGGGIFVLADDSGLEVDALQGAPGVHSARFAALDTGQSGNSPTAENNAKLLRLLKAVPEARRTARFRCVIALAPVPEPSVEGASPVCYANEAELGTRLFEGVCEGRIAIRPSGRGGFGYDPLFVPNGYHQTFGELSEDIKNRLSHRARALALLKRQILNAK